MLKKNFISLAFSVNKLQIVQLNSSKNKISKYSTYDLPEGLIRDHRVMDVDYLAKILKSVWKKVGIKEKSVGIVVPEFSTFIKLLTLPKLEINELNEAVEWQAHDFLPKKVINMAMDWKIVKRLEDGYQVLAIAIEKEILKGYIDAAGSAGLFPLIVETPSLSLVRSTQNETGGKLIIYGNFNETILIIAEGEKIFGSSVVSSANQKEIEKTILNMLNHYQDITIDKILVGGIGLDQNLFIRLQDSLKKPVNKLEVNISGLSKEDLQKYLIPLSLQFKIPTEPADENTINLLPKTVVDLYRNKRFEVQIWSLMMITTFIIWISFLAIAGTYIFLSQQISNYKSKSQNELNLLTQTKEVRAKIKKINDTATKTLNIVKATTSPNLVYNAIENARPEGIEILEYRLDLDNGEIEIFGKAATRNDLIKFKQSLEENKSFSHIIIPISSFEVESNLSFNLSFLYGFKE